MMRPRGISLDENSCVVGDSLFCPRPFRRYVPGCVHFFDRWIWKRYATLTLPAAPTEIRRIDGKDLSISNYLAEQLSRQPIRSFPPGVVLVQQGSVVRQLHLLAKGITKRPFLERNGRELIVGLRYGPGMIAGDYTMLGISCPLTVTTVSECSVYLVPAQALQQLLEGKPKFILHISRLLACESAEYASALMEFSSASTRQRLVELLKKLGLVEAIGHDECRS
jgi:CRP-like cAMP-binding protein